MGSWWRTVALVVAGGAPLLAARPAAAATCSFNSVSGELTVGFDGTATVTATESAILLDGADCGGATVSNTDLITVNGGAGADTVIFNADSNTNETVDCGAGVDDAEADGDTLVNCEL